MLLFLYYRGEKGKTPLAEGYVLSSRLLTEATHSNQADTVGGHVLA